jgi:hypothetical protein
MGTKKRIFKDTNFYEEMGLTIEEIQSFCEQTLKTLEEKVFHARGVKEAITVESIMPVEKDVHHLFGCIKENIEYIKSLIETERSGFVPER